MKTYYVLISLLSSFGANASPLGGSDDNIYGPLHSKVDLLHAPDPPPAPTPLPLSTDGVLADGSIINYSPNNLPSGPHSCWTVPLSRPPPTQPYVSGTCSVCVVLRDDLDGSGDYQFWARDNDNNAMGNMGAGAKVWPMDNDRSAENGGSTNSITQMGGYALQLYAMLATNPAHAQVNLAWFNPPHTFGAPLGADSSLPQMSFDTTPGGASFGSCYPAGNATNGAVIYFQCVLHC